MCWLSAMGSTQSHRSMSRRFLILVAPARTSLQCTEGDSTTCTPRLGLCNRGPAMRSLPLMAATALVIETSFQVLEEVLVKDWQLKRVSQETPQVWWLLQLCCKKSRELGQSSKDHGTNRPLRGGRLHTVSSFWPQPFIMVPSTSPALWESEMDREVGDQVLSLLGSLLLTPVLP